MAKVFYLLDALHAGGLERSMLEIVHHLRRTEPVVCYIYPGHSLRPAFEQAGIRLISLNVPGKYAFGATWRRLHQALSREKPDIIHLAGLYALLVGRAAGRRAGIPVVDGFTNEPYTAAHYATIPARSRWKLGLIQTLDRLSLPWVTHFISVSEAVRDRYAQVLGAPPAKVSVVYRGRDPQPFLQAEAGAGRRLRQALAIEPGTPVLLNVARLIPRKGQEELLRALPLIQRTCGPVRLLVAGAGHHRPQLEALIESLGLGQSVTLLGHRDDIPALLHLADLFLFPSHYEGHPGALVEAMFAARPIVASDIPVHRETITPPETGLLTPLDEPEAIAQAVIRLLNNPAEAGRMGEQARAVAMERFHIDRIAARYEEIYDSVLRG